MNSARSKLNATDSPCLRAAHSPGGLDIALMGDWTTLGLTTRDRNLERSLLEYARNPRASWNLCELKQLDHTGALLLWHAWGRALPDKLQIPRATQVYFAHLPQADARELPRNCEWRHPQQSIARLGKGVLQLLEELRDVIALIGRLFFDTVDLARHPHRWPGREISAGIYRAGAQAVGILTLVGFLIGVVLSYLSGDQLRRFGAEHYVVNLLGIGCVRELGPLLAAILVAGRSGSSMTAQLGVMRLNEELDALTTIGVPATQRLILPKVFALALSQPLTGLLTTAVAILGGMAAAHLSLDIAYSSFLHELPVVVPLANYWIGLAKGVVFGTIIALVACHFGLRVKPNTESLGAGTTQSVVTAISSVLIADAVFAVLFSHVGI